MELKLKESDAIQAFNMLRELVGPDHHIHSEFQDGRETLFFSVREWPARDGAEVKRIEAAIRPVFDQWFPPKEDDYVWMVGFYHQEECSDVIIGGHPLPSAP